MTDTTYARFARDVQGCRWARKRSIVWLVSVGRSTGDRDIGVKISDAAA
jgi:hypothetical protein